MSELRTAIVTGAANGIGQAIARAAVQRGYRVVTCDLQEMDTKEYGSDVHVAGDLLDAGVRAQVIDAALNGPGANGRLYALFNNVGMTLPYVPTLDISPERWERLWGINVTVPFLLSQAAAVPMIEAGEGVMVNTASLAGLAGIAKATDYVATKHAIVGITKSLAIEWGQLGIRVNAIAPGLTGTETARNAVNATSPGLFERRGRSVPLGRIAEPEDQAKAAMYLASDEASYIAGIVLVCDGGTLAQHPGYALS